MSDQAFKPLELTLPGRGDNASYVKVIVNIRDNERILGMHYLGWNAGEISFADAMLTYADIC
jgi:hypothetical protein